MLDNQSKLLPDLDSDSLSFPPIGNADTELEWFFTQSESDMGDRSNFMGLVHGTDDPSMDDRAEASHARRIIKARLLHLGVHDAGVLAAAYAARNWPKTLRERLGRVTGVAMRLASADIGLPDDDDELAELEIRTARRLDDGLTRQGDVAVARVRERGLMLLRRAFWGYVRERGGATVTLMKGVRR